MHVRSDPPRRAGEQRRYFPDWTRRLLAYCEELEADHNSYLAGGYAEEFGYRAQPGFSRGVPLLDGEPPEQCPEWRGQAIAMHPGYPIRPHPIALDRQPDGALNEPAMRLGTARHAGGARQAQEPANHGTFFAVTERPYERARRRLVRRAAAAWRRSVITLGTLPWSLPRR